MISIYNPELKAEMINRLRAEYEAKNALHEPSGKLSASQLGKPLLEQVLKIIGVPNKPADDYALGLFERGNQAEDWFVKLFQPDETQKEVSYRGVIGFVDAIKDGHVYEVKSVKNSQVQYLDPENLVQRFTSLSDGSKVRKRVFTGPKFQHVLQGALYALGTKSESFTVVYVSADDLRCYPHTIQTAEAAPMVDSIITEVANQLRSGTLPEFKPRADFDGQIQSWQTDAKYSSYPEFVSLSPELAMTKLKNQYPNCWEKLTGFTAKEISNG